MTNRPSYSTFIFFLVLGSAPIYAQSGSILPPIIQLLLLDENEAESGFISAIDTDGAALSIRVAGNYAYVADGNNGLVVVNISDPSSPFIESTLSEPAFAVEISGNQAVISSDNNELLLIDLSTPSAPQVVGVPFDISDEFGSLSSLETFINGIAFIIGGEFSGDVPYASVDFSDPDDPVFGSLSGGPDIASVQASNGFLLIARGFFGAGGAFNIVSDFGSGVSNFLPTDSQSTTGGYSKGIAAYTVTRISSVSNARIIPVIDVSDLSDIEMVTHLEAPDSFIFGSKVIGSGNKLYAELFDRSFNQIAIAEIDVSSELSPSIVKVIESPSLIQDIESSNEHLFLALGQSGVSIYRP